MNIRVSATFLILILCLCLPGHAQESGFDILTIGPNTLALGMNETITASLLGASDIYSNPANLALEPSSSLSADYSLWIADLANSHIAVNFKLGKGALALGLLSSSADDFELRTQPGPSQGSFSVTFFSTAAAYARKIGPFALGGTAQFLSEEFLASRATGFAFNLGLSSQWLNDRLTVASTVRNLGSMNELDQESTTLPSQWRTGLRAELFKLQPANRELPVEISAAADLSHPLTGNENRDPITEIDETETFLSFSLIVDIANTLKLHTGYRTEDSARPFSFGSTVKLSTFRINYAFIPFNTGFGDVHSIGFIYGF